MNRITPTDQIVALIEEGSRRHEDRPFLLYKGQWISWAKLDWRSGQVARGLAELHVKKGDKIAILLDNSPEYLYFWFGINKLGAIEVSVNTAFKGDILKYILEQSDATAIVVGSKYLDVLAPELPGLPALHRIVIADGDAVPLAEGIQVVPYSYFASLDGDFHAQVDPTDIASLGYTSGTTGPSKGAMMVHNRIIKVGQDMVTVRGITSDDVLYTCLPLFHGNAKFQTVIPAMLAGARVALDTRFSANRFWDEIRTARATQFNYLGVMISLLFKQAPDPKDADNPARIGWGAGAAKEMIADFEKRFGVYLMEGYGLTEGGIHLSNTLTERRIGSCGKPLPGYEVEVVDEWDNPVPSGTVGELVIRARRPYTTMIGYYKMPDKTVEIYRNFWLHTGDLAYQDNDGFFYFVDRKKDAIRRRGENISSFEVEACVNSHPAILEAAAFPIHSDVTEDDVMIVAVLRPGSDLSYEAFMDYCSNRMPYFWVPRYVELWTGPLPRTPTNKVEKYKLRERGVTEITWDREKAGYKVQR